MAVLFQDYPLRAERSRHSRQGGAGGWQGESIPLSSDKNGLLSFEHSKHWNVILPTAQESLHTKPSVTQQVVTCKTQHFPPGGLAMQIPSVVLPFFSSFVSLFFSHRLFFFSPYPSQQEQAAGFISSLSLSNCCLRQNSTECTIDVRESARSHSQQ